jgi:hypothetical protein
MNQGGLFQILLIGKKLMTFCANGVFVFQGIILGALTKQFSK